MTDIQVGDRVRVVSPRSPQRGKVGEVYAVRRAMSWDKVPQGFIGYPGLRVGDIVYSVKFEVPGKNRMHAFYFEGEIEHE